jgi:hypothetical protein
VFTQSTLKLIQSNFFPSLSLSFLTAPHHRAGRLQAKAVEYSEAGRAGKHAGRIHPRDEAND